MRYLSAWKLISRGCEEREVPWVVDVTSLDGALAMCLGFVCLAAWFLLSCYMSLFLQVPSAQKKKPNNKKQFWKSEMRFLLLSAKHKLMIHGVLVLDLLTYHSPKGNYVKASEYILKIIIKKGFLLIIFFAAVNSEHVSLFSSAETDLWFLAFFPN